MTKELREAAQGGERELTERWLVRKVLQEKGKIPTVATNKYSAMRSKN